MTDRFTLKDEKGYLLVEKQLVEHIKVYLDAMKPAQGKKFVVKSEVTGFEIEVTRKTSPEEWREYSTKCLMALD